MLYVKDKDHSICLEVISTSNGAGKEVYIGSNSNLTLSLIIYRHYSCVDGDLLPLIKFHVSGYWSFCILV